MNYSARMCRAFMLLSGLVGSNPGVSSRISVGSAAKFDETK